MINEYTVAEIIELGRAHDIVLGEKIIDSMDSLTLEFDSRFVPATDD
jgi:hypothetical protein